MRTTSSIAKCARDTKEYLSDIFTSSVSVLPLGECSTVPGPTPYCILSSWGSGEFTAQVAIINSLRYYLGSILRLSGTIKTRIAIVCDTQIIPRTIVAGITPTYPVMVYTAGVKEYLVGGMAIIAPGDAYDS